METHFAPAQRADLKKVASDHQRFSNFRYVSEIVNALPYIAAILNKERQIVFANKALLDLLKISNLDEYLGMRPGELIKCIHACENEAGCGTSENCRYCGAANAIIECLNTGNQITKECRITALDGQKEVAYDFQVSASPFNYRRNDFVVLSFSDISNEKRRHMLERIFFHDILNTAGGLRGFIEVMRMEEDPEERQQYLTIADELSNNLIQEIQAQQQLLAAERGALKINVQQIIPVGILHEVVNHLARHHVAEDKTIHIDPEATAKRITTDPVLLKRVLVNLLKNALEASPKNETISLGCFDLDDEKVFWVHNPGFMDKSVQSQIFKRSFSTKGEARGLGTYSIKLLSEQYLQGKVTFTSSRQKGTIFRVYLPVQIE